ncbi:MAG: hypothetical protein ABI697_01420 [Devosia sp.]
MAAILDMFSGPNAPMMAGVVAFVAFFLIARLGRARQSVAFAFAFTPLLVMFALGAVALA